jgi:aconitate hydratase
MGKTLTEKVLESHLVGGRLKRGEEIAVSIDDTLTQDATGTMAWLQFEATGVPEVRTRAVSFIDHNTVQMGFENADDHDYLQSAAEKYGAVLSKAGNGICHQLFLERFAIPGRTLVGSDSHTPTAGGMGSLAIGVGGLDVALAMAGQAYRLKMPEVIGIHLKGELNDWVSAKDIILKVIEHYGTKNKGKVFEYFGPGVESLSVPERATITNMGAELGVTTSIFPSDKNTLEFLTMLGRQGDYKPISADPDADYDEVLELDLSELTPMIVLAPGQGKKGLGNAVSLEQALGTEVNQVCVGACTNSSYHDLMVVARALQERKVHENVELIITPGSRAVAQLIIDSGGYSLLNRAGARITEPVCGPCIGQGYSPRSKGVRVATFNRNFCGRSGTKDAEVFLSSPEVAAACALTGKITDPRVLFAGQPYERFSPACYPAIDSLFIFNKPNSDAEIIRGPNISKAPKNTPLADSLQGIVTIKLGDSITTDDITPAGPWLKFRSNVPKYSEAVFSAIDPDFHKRALEHKTADKANIVIAGEGYGEGSSREHAAICPMYLGVKAVVAKGFQRIHADNLVNFGVMPLMFRNPDDYESLDQDDELSLCNIPKGLEENSLVLRNLTKGTDIPLVHELSQRQTEMISAGGALNYLK